jgi:hypothetical protein
MKESIFLQKMAKLYAQEETMMIMEGDFVTFAVEDETEIGRVEYVMTEGYFSIPESKYYTEATPENPALLIRIYEEKEETEYMIGKLYSEVQPANLDEYEANEMENEEED